MSKRGEFRIVDHQQEHHDLIVEGVHQVGINHRVQGTGLVIQAQFKDATVFRGIDLDERLAVSRQGRVGNTVFVQQPEGQQGTVNSRLLRRWQGIDFPDGAGPTSREFSRDDA